MSKVLEAAWPQFVNFFQGAPKLRQEKLVIYFFNTRESWIRKLTQDGHKVPNDGVGGRYFHSNKTAYFYRQPTRYYTRCLLLHEAAHQFHYLTRRLDQEIGANWYIEGVAEHLSLHHWDGQNLQLGALPVSLENYPGKAFRTMTTTPRPLVAMIQNGQTNRPLGALVIRYLATKEPKKFSRFAKAIEKRDASERLFQRSFADYPTFTKPFLTWLESHQQPLDIRFDEWERTGSGSMLGHSKDRISITTFKDTVSLVQCHTRNRQDETGRVLPRSRGLHGSALQSEGAFGNAPHVYQTNGSASSAKPSQLFTIRMSASRPNAMTLASAYSSMMSVSAHTPYLTDLLGSRSIAVKCGSPTYRGGNQATFPLSTGSAVPS